MARGSARRHIRTPDGARMPWLVTAVVVALAYQQSAYVPVQIKASLNIAVPVLAGLLLTQLSIRAVRLTAASLRAVLDRLEDGELVLRLPRANGGNADETGFRLDADCTN